MIPSSNHNAQKSRVGSKNIVSKDVLDTNIPIFTTQKKRILEFAKEKQIPSKFVLPLFEESMIDPTKSDISEKYATLEEMLRINLDENKPISKIVETLHESYPSIAEKEILYFISDLIKLDNHFYKEAEIVFPRYKDPETFENEKINFEEMDIPKLLEKDKNDLKKIKLFFKNIVKIDPVLTSDMTLTKVTVEYDIITPNKEILLEMAPDLFANINLNSEIPYVQHNDQRSTKYKVFNGETFETRPPFKLFEQKFGKFEDKNMLYFIVFADKIKNIQDFTKSSFISAAINLDKSTLSFKYLILSHRSEQEILNAFQIVLPDLKFKNRREKNYGADFNVYYMSVREDSFLDLLLTEPFQQETKNLFSSVLFADEFEKPISEKKKLKLYYDTNLAFDHKLKSERGSLDLEKTREKDLTKTASLGFYMTQYISGYNDAQQSKGRYTMTNFERNTKTEEKIIGIKTTPFQSILLEPKTPYITVSISKAVNRFVLFQFMNIFSRLLNLYNQVKDQYEKIYENLIPELKDQEVIDDDLTLIRKPKPKDEEEKQVGISTIAPEIFTSSYSRDCQFKNQPIIISEDEIDFWKNQKIKKGKQMIERPVLKLGDYHFVCTSDDHPYVAFKENLDDERKYPYYPCCYSKPQKEIKKREKGTSSRSKAPIKTNKVLGMGGLGNIPTAIEEMIKGAFEKEVNLFRMGTFIDANSFLACVLIALQDKNFLKLEISSQKEQYIKKIKKAIFDSANFNVASSELFDITNEERKELFMRQNEFLDPALFYRVLEEVFGLNIFVFSASLPKPNVETTYSLEISRFSAVPIHSYRKEYPTMLVYKHWGSETDHLRYPQCELIVAGLETIDALLFTSDLAQYLLKGYFISSEVFGKIYIPNDKYFQNYDSSVIYKLFNTRFVEKFLDPKSPIKAIGQIIDEKGKLAGLHLQNGNTKMTIGVPPFAPQDLPVVNKIYKINLQDALKIFKNLPTGFSYQEDKAVAVWFKILSMEFGIQVPIEPLDSDKIKMKYKLPEVPENRFRLEKQASQIQRLFKLQKDVNIVVQIVRWLFLLYIKDKRNITIDEKIQLSEEFIDSFVKLKGRREETDSSKIYDFSNLERKLPSIKQNLKQIMKELEESAPTLIQDGKIIISGKQFYQRIIESLEHFIRLNLPIAIPQYLDEYYASIYDYPRIPKNIVFLSKIDFDRWFKQAKENPTSSYPVYYSLKGKLNEFNNPYLYALEIEKPSVGNPFGENFLFLIQNAPFINSKQSALANAILWKNNKINRPEVSEIPISEFNNYKVFTIGQNEKLALIEDKSNPNRKYETIFVLKYPTIDRYASVLPL
jgi:hypothetical protein